MSLLPSRGATQRALEQRWRLLFDDAAIFPPGNLPLAEAVLAHHRHRSSWYADLVGPLVLSPSSLAEIGRLRVEVGVDVGAVAVTVPSPDAAVSVLLDELPGMTIVALEVGVPDDFRPGTVVPTLDAALGELRHHARGPAGNTPVIPTVYVELPHDNSRDALLADLAGTPYRAKFRTGGVRADLYPSEAELAAGVVATVHAGVPFKATAGLHHALRNTDPITSFEQQGFLNLLAATAAAEDGADAGEVAVILAERDATRLSLLPRTSRLLTSIGTCSITEPIDELTGLGLLSLQGAR